MAKFDVTKEVTKAFEGGFWNDPSAGWTYKGITAKFYKSWPGFARIRQLTNGRTPARYTIFNDAVLDKMVDDFYRVMFWDNKVNGNWIDNQTIANMAYDFILHKENAAIRVINEVAKSIDNTVDLLPTGLSMGVVSIMNTVPAEFYRKLRQARIDYYNNSKSFSKPMKAAFVARVKKLPESIGRLGNNPCSNF